MLYYLLATLYILSCLLLVLVVLLQQGKGGDIASAFGGGGSQTAFGARAGATVLTKATAILGVLFMIGAIALGILGRGGASGSLMQGLGGPQQQTPAPTTPAPRTRRPRERSRPRRRSRQRRRPRMPGRRSRSRRRRSRRRRSRPVSRSSRGSFYRRSSPSLRKWRNWQTHQLEGLAVAIPWGFESPLSHQPFKSMSYRDS